jgi:signal transduction histidine kinase
MMIGEELVGAVAARRRDGDVYPYAQEDAIAISAIAALTAQQMQTTVLRQRAAEGFDEQFVDQLNQEYRRIAHDLHDGIVQDLAYLRLRLETLERVIAVDGDRASQEAAQIRGELNNSIDNLRSMIANFRRPRQRTRGITGELRDLASDLAARPIAAEQPRLELNLSEISGVRLAPEVERAVVGIVREALQNIRKHAGASSVRVEVQRAEDELQVMVLDDGSGFSGAPAHERPGAHFGMEQMRELAEDMGGSLRIASNEKRGTRVEARIPLVPGGKGTT